MKIIQIMETKNWIDERGKTMILGLDEQGMIYALLIVGKTHMGRTAYKWTRLAVENNDNE